MKKCLYCNKEFYARHIGKECSIKCKILQHKIETPTGCWLFKKSSSGLYSKLRWNMKWYLAHRASYAAFISDIPEKLVVMHICDIPKCVNPKHLKIGTQAENCRDSFIKNRKPIGENNHFTRYTDKQITEMRLLKSEGFTYTRLSNIFNCTISYLYYVIKMKNRR